MNTKRDTVFYTVIGVTIALEFFVPVPILSGFIESLFVGFFVPIIGLRRVLMLSCAVTTFALVKISDGLFMLYSQMPAGFAPLFLAAISLSFLFGIIGYTLSSYVTYFIYRKIFKKWFKSIDAICER